MIHNSERCNSPSFLSYTKWCPITCYWSDIALHQMGRQHQFISSYWISANINGYLAHVLLKHLSAITELMKRLAGFVCERGGEGVGKKKKSNVRILLVNLSSYLARTGQDRSGSLHGHICFTQVAACPFQTRERSVPLTAYFLLIIKWIIKAQQLRKNHINHLQYVSNAPLLRHSSHYKWWPRNPWFIPACIASSRCVCL